MVITTSFTLPPWWVDVLAQQRAERFNFFSPPSSLTLGQPIEKWHNLILIFKITKIIN